MVAEERDRGAVNLREIDIEVVIVLVLGKLCDKRRFTDATGAFNKDGRLAPRLVFPCAETFIALTLKNHVIYLHFNKNQAPL